MKYTVEGGDSLIKILRKFGLTQTGMLNEVVKRNNLKDANFIKVGQELDLPEPEFYDLIEPVVVTAKKQDYSRTPVTQLPNTRDVDGNGNVIPGYADRVQAYAQALRDKSLTINQVPVQYRQQAYNQSIRNATNEAAPYVAKWVLGAPWSIPDAIVRGGMNEGRKLIARTTGTPKEVVDSDYGLSNYFGNFSWTGKKFESEHPNLALAADILITPSVMVGAENAAARVMDGATSNIGPRLMANARSTAKAMGVVEQEVPRAVEQTLPGRVPGVKFTGSSIAKGSGKTGTVTRGARGGYSAKSSFKGSYGHQASYTPKGELRYITPKELVVPADNFVGTGYWHGLYTPLLENRNTPYVIVTPEESHIEEIQPTQSRWVTNTKATEVRVPYRPEYEKAEYYEAQAPVGASVKEQPITRESLVKREGLVRRSAGEVPGKVYGSTPSGWYSGYGHTYGTNGGPWLRKNGGILKRK